MGWTLAGPVFLAAILLFAAANWRALEAWVRLWLFAGQDYGFVVLATSAWLIWRARDKIGQRRPSADWRGVLLAVPLGAALWLAYLVDIRVAQLTLIVAGVGVLIWTVLGSSVFRVVAYPVAFVFLAVPFWNFLQPLLQEMTVHATVIALRLTGVPVYVDETYIHVPHGAILVLEHCSGTQFFQAGFTLGALYAYLNFRLPGMRLLALAEFVFLAILGNWVRVYALVFLGALTGQQHFMFGWAVFAVLLIPAFWLGARLRGYEDKRLAGLQPVCRGLAAGDAVRSSPAATIGAAAAATILLTTGSIAANWSTGSSLRQLDTPHPIQVSLPWSGPYAARGDWHPQFGNADAETLAVYRKGEREVASYNAYYTRQRQDAEVVNELNLVFDPVRWRPRGGYAGTDYAQVPGADGGNFVVIETRLENLQTGAERLVWHWYRVGGQIVIRPWRAKLAQLIGLIKGRPHAMAIVLSTDAPNLAEARDLLRDFVSSNREALQVVTPAAATQ